MRLAATGKSTPIKLVQQQPSSQAGSQSESPGAGMCLVIVGDAQQRPHRQGNGESQDDVWNQDAGK